MFGLSFAVPKLLTPYLLDFHAHSLAAFRRPFFLHYLPHMFLMFFGTLVTGAAVFPFPDFGMPVLKEEGEILAVPNIDVVDFLKEYILVKCLESEGFGGQLTEPVVTESFDHTAVLVSTSPVGKFCTASTRRSGFAEVAAAMLAFDPGGKAGDVISGDGMVPAVIGSPLSAFICPTFLLGVSVPMVLITEHPLSPQQSWGE